MIIINCLFGTLKKSFESCSVQSGETGGVSFWNVRETGGQKSHFGACICPTPALVKVFLVDTIIELLLKGIVHFEIKIWYLSAYPKGIQDVGVFFSSVDPI